MRRTGLLLSVMLVLFGTSMTAHADINYRPTGTVETRYGMQYNNSDPYYNGSPYIPVPASVLYGCHSSSCLAPTTATQQQYPQQYSQPYTNYQPYTSGIEKGHITQNYTNNVYPTTYYPGTPNTGAGGEAGSYLTILALALLGAAGAGIYLLRTRRHA